MNDLQTYLLENSHEIGALKVWQFQELSHQAAERIMSSPASEAINVLTDISQNFPMQVTVPKLFQLPNTTLCIEK